MKNPEHASKIFVVCMFTNFLKTYFDGYVLPNSYKL